MKIYYDKDADIQQIRNKKVAVIHGSQGHACPQHEERRQCGDRCARRGVVEKRGARADSGRRSPMRLRRPMW